ncbi:hypothetical protein F383_00988 [Gossypium arboreum]|uniref:Uncharacterized protein n=1 Tax=Gossypium arboreum TaxID=29729 RepID=A0A0B0P1L6_GOSAR|nr:hypothetical protein F383_00988 [Gossypium arboreum]
MKFSKRKRLRILRNFNEFCEAKNSRVCWRLQLRYRNLAKGLHKSHYCFTV